MKEGQVSSYLVAIDIQSKYIVLIKGDLTCQKACTCKNGEMFSQIKRVSFLEYTGELPGARFAYVFGLFGGKSAHLRELI